MTRRKLREAVGNAQRFLAEVKFLKRSEGCAMLAEVIERDNRPIHLNLLSVAAFTASVPGLNLTGLADKHLHELTEDDRDLLAALLRARCKPLDYASDGAAA